MASYSLHLMKVPYSCQAPMLPEFGSFADCVDIKCAINGIIERVGVISKQQLLCLLMKQAVDELITIHNVPCVRALCGV